MASFAVKVLSTRPSFAVAVLEFILSSNVPSGQSLPSYVEAVKNMQYSCVLELHKLAMCFPDYFWVSDAGGTALDALLTTTIAHLR